MTASSWLRDKTHSRRFVFLTKPLADAGRVSAGASVIILCLYSGNFLQRALHVPAPGSVLGMAVLLMLLQGKVVPDSWVRTPCTWLLLLLPACFVPIYVTSLSASTFWKQDCLTLLPAAIGGALMTLSVAGWLAWKTRK